MVWAVGFKFTKAGHHLGHQELDGDLRKVEYVDTTRDWDSMGGGFEPGDLNWGRAIKPDHLPTRMKRDGKRYGMPDVTFGRGLFIVNDKFKNVVESLKPDVHQYFPIDMVWEDGTLAQKMYIFNICNRLDTVSREASTAQLKRGRIWEPSTGKMVFSTTRVGDRHIWIDRHIVASGTFFCSDAMNEAMTRAEISGWDSGRLDTTEAM